MSLGVQLFCAKQNHFLIEPFSQNVDPSTRFVGIVRRLILSQQKRRPSLTVQRLSHPDIAGSFYFPGLKFSNAFAEESLCQSCLMQQYATNQERHYFHNISSMAEKQR